MLIRKAEVRTHNFYDFECRGVFAKEAIKAGELVWSCNGKIAQTYTKLDIDAEEKRELLLKYSFMVADGQYCSTSEPEESGRWFFNHSCQPNCAFQGESLIAIADMDTDDQLVYDYAFSETEGSLHRGMTCICGAAACRKVLTFAEWRNIEWRASNEGRLSPFVLRKTQETCWYHPNVVAHTKADGSQGLYSIGKIQAKEVVLVFTGKVVSLDALLEAGPRFLELSLQVHDNLWQMPIPEGPNMADFINHCCDANLGMEDSTTAVARRDIAEDEELTIDYGTVNSGVILSESDNFQCRCGLAACREVVRSNDWQLPQVQHQYWPYFPPFVRRLILKQQT